MSALGLNATDASWLLSWAARMSIKVWIWKPMVAGLAGTTGAFRVHVSEVAAWPTSLVSTVSKLPSRSQQPSENCGMA